MEETDHNNSNPNGGTSEMRTVIRSVIDEFMHAEQTRSEPAYKTELLEERKRREQLEQRVNELVRENKKSREAALEAERSSAIRAELQRLGVGKVELAYRIVRDDVHRREDGSLTGKGEIGEIPLREYLEHFVNDNPELLPPRIAGGSGMQPVQRLSAAERGVDLDKIRPGMDPEELERVRKEISRIAMQSLRGF
jgi:hypothetical protein